MTATPCRLRAPACASAAPIKPPNNVCDELDGMPNHQVRRFQQMAAIRPLKITRKSIKSLLTELAMVLPILNSLKTYLAIKKAAKLKKAAQSTAWNGVRTLVLTIVAMELAASWNPLI